MQLGLGTRLTGTQRRKLLGVPKEKFDLEARFVGAIEAVHIHIGIRAEQHRPPVSAGIDHEHHTQIAPKMHVVEDLVIEHDGVVLARYTLKACQVVPMDLAVISLGSPGSWASRSLVEIAQIGVTAQLANLMQPQGVESVKEFTFAVIAIRYHMA